MRKYSFFLFGQVQVAHYTSANTGRLGDCIIRDGFYYNILLYKWHGLEKGRKRAKRRNPEVESFKWDFVRLTWVEVGGLNLVVLVFIGLGGIVGAAAVRVGRVGAVRARVRLGLGRVPQPPLARRWLGLAGRFPLLFKFNRKVKKYRIVPCNRPWAIFAFVFRSHRRSFWSTAKWLCRLSTGNKIKEKNKKYKTHFCDGSFVGRVFEQNFLVFGRPRAHVVLLGLELVLEGLAPLGPDWPFGGLFQVPLLWK